MVKQKTDGVKVTFAILAVILLILAGIAVYMTVRDSASSIKAEKFQYNGLDFYQKTNKSLAEVIILTLPYFWLVFLALFIFVVYYNIKHTKKGYRYSLVLIIGISVAASLVLGILFHRIGWGQDIDDILGERAPLYGQVFNRQMDFWFEPQEGRLTGLIISQDEKGLSILDLEGNTWEVKFSPEQDLENTFKFIEQSMETGMPIKLIGQIIEDNQFQAEIIRPMGPPGRRFFHRPGMMRPDFFQNIDCKKNNCPLAHPPLGP